MIPSDYFIDNISTFTAENVRRQSFLLWKVHTGSRVIPPAWRRSQLHSAAVRQGARRLLR